MTDEKMNLTKIIDYNENCTRPDGCYDKKTGKCLCVLGCDCHCHLFEDIQEETQKILDECPDEINFDEIEEDCMNALKIKKQKE